MERWQRSDPVHDRPAEQEGRASAQEGAGHEQAQRAVALRAREVVADERDAAGRDCRLAEANAEPRDEQRPEAAHQSRRRRHRAPDADADGEDPAPAAAVRKPADRHADENVEDPERGTEQQPDLEVAQAEVALDRLDQQARQEAVDVGDDLGDGQQRRHVPGIAARGIREFLRRHGNRRRDVATCQWPSPPLLVPESNIRAPRPPAQSI